MGRLFDIQSNALYDGPGIRSCVFFKGCSLKCAWCHNPESQSRDVQMGWWRERCQRCGACVAACEERALTLQDDSMERDDGICRRCGRCADVCENGAQEAIGYDISAEELVDRLLLDRPFYEESGGGVTLSGGEPTVQSRFLFRVLGRLRDEGIHTAVETCGHFPGSLLASLVEAADLVLFDFKHISPGIHLVHTGVDNRQVLENLETIIDLPRDRLLVRVPVIPGFNADGETMEAMASHLFSLGYRGRVELMPYHNWSKGKFERIGRPIDYRNLEPLTVSERDGIDDCFRAVGLDPIWEG